MAARISRTGWPHALHSEIGDAYSFEERLRRVRDAALSVVQDELTEVRQTLSDMRILADGTLFYDIDRMRLAAVAKAVLHIVES